MECDRTGVYETYYIPKDQTDKSCYMKIDYVNFERKNQNCTKYCKFSDFDRERIQPVEEFLFHKEIKEFVNMENKCFTIPNPKSIEKLEDFDDITSLKNSENYDVYYKSRVMYNHDQKKFLQFLKDLFYYYSDHIDPDFIDAYKTVLDNMNSFMNKSIIINGYCIEKYIYQETLGSHRNMTVYRCYMSNGSEDKEIANVIILSDDDVTAYRIMVDDRVFKQKFLVIYTQEYSNEKFEYKLYFDPILDLKENQYSTKLYLSQVDRKWYRKIYNVKISPEVTIITNQNIDNKELVIRYRFELDKKLIKSYLSERFKIDTSNGSMTFVWKDTFDYGQIGFDCKIYIEFMNKNITKAELYIFPIDAEYLYERYKFEISYNHHLLNPWTIIFNFETPKCLVTNKIFRMRGKDDCCVSVEDLSTVTEIIEKGRYYLSSFLDEYKYLIIPEMDKNNKDMFTFYYLGNALNHFKEDTIARKFL